MDGQDKSPPVGMKVHRLRFLKTILVVSSGGFISTDGRDELSPPTVEIKVHQSREKSTGRDKSPPTVEIIFKKYIHVVSSERFHSMSIVENKDNFEGICQ